MSNKITKTEEEWKMQLSPEQFHVARKAGTEPAFTGKYWDTKEKGTYNCVCCGTPLFESVTKFNSGTGWPSFYKPVDPAAVAEHTDVSYGRKLAVPNATRIWDMYFLTGQSRPACAIA
jgi:peptide-methionine (R)-S-oxide reductase